MMAKTENEKITYNDLLVYKLQYIYGFNDALLQIERLNLRVPKELSEVLGVLLKEYKNGICD